MGGMESCCQSQQDDKMLVTKMDLSHCGFTEVPNIVFNVERCIETLILSSNRITSLPPQLFHCQELRHLNLCDNCLTSIPPAVGSLLHLISLKLDKNNLKELPENLKTCRKLKRLSLNNNLLKQMPVIVTQLINLEELYMNDCELSYLPASVGRLSKLKILELRNNSLCNLPLSMSRLMSLTRLDIGDNEFVEFPTCINNLKSLTELLLDNNDLEEISDVRNLTSLEHLDASYNHVSNVSDTIGHCKSLIMLNLSFNYIEQLPENIGDLMQLQTFQLEMNELTEVPKTIGRLVNLEDFNICFNRLCNLPSSIGLLRNLRNLNVSRNMIEEFPPEIGSCTKLAIINASYNRLQVLPSEIGYLNNLKVLDVVGNFLMYLPITIINLRGVRAIWLSANQNVPLIPFTEDVNIASGERFLTNIALPQLGEIPSTAESADPSSEPPEKFNRNKKIRFVEDEDLLPGKLHRTPTPFPKELRAPNRKHHVRGDDMRPEDDYVNVIAGKILEKEPSLHPPTSPVTKNGSGLLTFTESCVTMIREANIRRNPKDAEAGHHFREESAEQDRSFQTGSNAIPDLHGQFDEEFHRDANKNENRDFCNGRTKVNDRNGNPQEFQNCDSRDFKEEGNVSRRREENIYSDLSEDYHRAKIASARTTHRCDEISGDGKNPGNAENFESSTGMLEAGKNVNFRKFQRNWEEDGRKYSERNPNEFGQDLPERAPSKQDMASLAEIMKSRNIAPPCYEIAKMYSTKAAFFERHRNPSS